MTAGFDGASQMRIFPTLVIKVTVSRRSGYFVLNVLLPTAVFVPLAHLQFLVADCAGRLEVASAVCHLGRGLGRPPCDNGKPGVVCPTQLGCSWTPPLLP